MHPPPPPASPHYTRPSAFSSCRATAPAPQPGQQGAGGLEQADGGRGRWGGWGGACRRRNGSTEGLMRRRFSGARARAGSPCVLFQYLFRRRAARASRLGARCVGSNPPPPRAVLMVVVAAAAAGDAVACLKCVCAHALRRSGSALRHPPPWAARRGSSRALAAIGLQQDCYRTATGLQQDWLEQRGGVGGRPGRWLG